MLLRPRLLTHFAGGSPRTCITHVNDLYLKQIKGVIAKKKPQEMYLGKGSLYHGSLSLDIVLHIQPA
jgi:hypothetical protein